MANEITQAKHETSQTLHRSVVTKQFHHKLRLDKMTKFYCHKIMAWIK